MHDTDDGGIARPCSAGSSRTNMAPPTDPAGVTRAMPPWARAMAETIASPSPVLGPPGIRTPGSNRSKIHQVLGIREGLSGAWVDSRARQLGELPDLLCQRRLDPGLDPLSLDEQGRRTGPDEAQRGQHGDLPHQTRPHRQRGRAAGPGHRPGAGGLSRPCHRRVVIGRRGSRGGLRLRLGGHLHGRRRRRDDHGALGRRRSGSRLGGRGGRGSGRWGRRGTRAGLHLGRLVEVDRGAEVGCRGRVPGSRHRTSASGP